MIAHINDWHVEQTVDAHDYNVEKLSAKRGAYIGLENTAAMIGLLHDIGKNTEAFDMYIRLAHEHPERVRRGEINHSSCGGRFIYEKYYKGGSPIERLTAQLMANAVMFHHGLNDCLTFDGEDRFEKRLYPAKEIYYEEAILRSSSFLKQYDLDNLFQKSVKEIQVIHEKAKALSKCFSGNFQKKHYNFLLGALQRMLISILIDSDWTDTASFMDGYEPEIYDEDQMKRIWSDFSEKIDVTLKELQGTDKISVLRKELSDACLQFADKPEGIYCLPIPTGGGKTFASMRYALEFAKKRDKKHIFYIAPFLSILEQNARDIREALGDEKGEYILEHHSNVIIDNENGEDLDKYETLTEAWVSPIIATTMVQFLNVLFSDRLQSVRRMHQLKDSVIIIDEIQSLPVKCIYMFNSMINFLAQCCGCSVILCSATQPLLGDVNIPVHYGTPKNMYENVDRYAIDFKRVCIEDKTIVEGYSSRQLRDFILEKFDDNMLIILNTKKAVRQLAEELKTSVGKDIQIIQLTNYMCAQNRSDVVKHLKAMLGKKKVICVSTQLIEAGVNISFQCVVRSLAGLDNIAQAAGRCNRHGELEMGYVYIVNYKAENVGSLTDIKLAQESMKSLLLRFNKDCTAYDNDLLSAKSMDMYYKMYFFEREKSGEMAYILKKEESAPNLYDLLSFNETGHRAYVTRLGRASGNSLCQAFSYAGRKFKAIEDEQLIGLIVPYDEGKELIQELKTCEDKKRIKILLKMLQRFTINLYKSDKRLQKLLDCHAIDTSVLDGRVFILDDGFYNGEEGVSEVLQDLIY